MTDAPAAPTVVVSRSVLPGREDDFVDWYRRIREAARAFPGHVRSEVQQPNEAHPGEWVTIYSFATEDQLANWLSSDERQRLVAEAAAYVDGAAKEQRVAGLAPAGNPVTVVFSQRIAPGGEERFAALHQDLVAILEDFDGFIAADLFPPTSGVQDEHVVVASFASRADLDSWLGSAERGRWVEKAGQVIEGDRTMNVVGGFGGWFPGSPTRIRGPKRWKQGVAVLLALFPTAMALTLLRDWLVPNMHVALGVFLGNVIAIAILTYLLMPRINRWLDSWLRR